MASVRKTMQDKASPLTMASSGTGSVPHLAMELLNDAAKLNGFEVVSWEDCVLRHQGETEVRGSSVILGKSQ